MSQPNISILLPQVAFNGSNLNTIGEKQPAAAYYVSGNSLQTISWNMTNFTGRLVFQASLVDSPSSNDSDWFTVHILYCDKMTQTSFANLQGNYVWIRAKIVDMSSGVIQHVKLSY